ncbi:MAG: TrbG/VirB9 family P-type conjugative transfer protein [Alphaproteobacteria bacterium]|nr:TrbG/VirB9 family P-type conjugative transfer protein [Alphaproteobacteria bacterium]
MTLRFALLAFAVLCGIGAAHAQFTTVPEPGPGDPRIRQVMFGPDQVVSIRGRLGYEMAIEFDPAERIENVSIGDSLSWQVTPNRKATLLFLKPMAKSAATSMTVVTTERIYSFVLTATDGGGPNDANAMFRLRFLYPAPPVEIVEAPPPAPPPAPPTQNLNFGYSWSGSKNLTPLRVFDDGQATWFEFAPDKDVPAVFILGADGKEEMANTRAFGAYTVADFVSQSFILRYGKAKTQVHNDAWRQPALPPGAPRARKGG